MAEFLNGFMPLSAVIQGLTILGMCQAVRNPVTRLLFQFVLPAPILFFIDFTTRKAPL
jgi:hypothetical protein